MKCVDWEGQVGFSPQNKHFLYIVFSKNRARASCSITVSKSKDLYDDLKMRVELMNSIWVASVFIIQSTLFGFNMTAMLETTGWTCKLIWETETTYPRISSHKLWHGLWTLQVPGAFIARSEEDVQISQWLNNDWKTTSTTIVLLVAL